MLILAVGDTHGKFERVKKDVKTLPIKLLLHTGDHWRDGQALASQLGLKCHLVSGNCDRGKEEPRERVLEVEGFRILITHGHLQNVKNTMNNLYYKAQQGKINIVIFGHTHVSYLEKVDNIWFMNPGSPSFPRAGTRPTYGLIDLQPGKAELRIVEV